MRQIIGITIAAVPVLVQGCGIEVPSVTDGRGALIVTVVDTSGLMPGSIRGEPFYLDSTDVAIESRTHIFTAKEKTDASGVVSFTRLDTGIYSIFARREMKLGSAKKVFTAAATMEVSSEATVIDTMNVTLVASSQLMINEVYYTGSCASMFYFYDQFVELYNSSTDTLYLDGMLLMRASPEKNPDTYCPDCVEGIHAFQFPGTPVTGREHPIYPSQCLVIASDATNHTQFCPAAVDLSHADWETFNALGNDFDNPSVPNLNCAIPGKTIDFLISLGHNGVFLATGEVYTITPENRMRVPIDMVVDGVEYCANPQYSKEISARVDAGYAGVGMTNYSARSIERRERGLDTNDSTFDFMILPRPTPGYFHAP